MDRAPEDFDRLNIENLIAFWTACRRTEHALSGGKRLFVSQSWPSRMWLGYGCRPSVEDVAEAIDIAGEAALTFPWWPGFGYGIDRFLERGELQRKMTQELMVASTEGLKAGPASPAPLTRVTASSVADWTSVAGESFGYPIDGHVISGLLDVSDCHLRVIEQDGKVVATGLLMQTGAVAGIHMVGVPPSRRRQGLARNMMDGLLALARELDCRLVTLQASNAAKPLYGQLGFESRGPLHSYRRA